jgi:hypothetical protein
MKYRRYRVVVLGFDDEQPQQPTKKGLALARVGLPKPIRSLWRALVAFVKLCNWSWQVWASWACLLAGTLILIRTFV